MGSRVAGECVHERMIFDVDVVKFNDTTLRRLVILGECKDCGQRMRFRGLPYDRPVDEAVSTPDAREAHIPFEMVAA